MKILLDTHVLIWYFAAAAEKIPSEVLKQIKDADSEVYFSSLAIFEIELKHANRPEAMPFTGEEIIEYCQKFGFKPLPLETKHTLAVKKLTRKENTPPHRDPFDRLMLGQAVVENMFFITHDNRIAEYDCPLICKI